MLARAQAGSGGASTEGAEENPFKDSADKTGECYQWAADGQCGSNPDFMLSSCKYSCWEWFDFRGKKYPGSPMCAALRHPAQRTWHAARDSGPSDAHTHAHARTHSSTLVHTRSRSRAPAPLSLSPSRAARATMEHRAPMRLTCCHVIHRDKKFNCHSWGKAGECKSNAVFMKKHCPESCKKHDDGSGDELCRKQAGRHAAFGQLARRRLLSAPERASGCPKLRPGSTEQPVGPRWPVISGLISNRRRAGSRPAPRQLC